MKHRLTFICRFHQHAKPYRISAVHNVQAYIIASNLARKYKWTIESVGLAI
jgi:hypothetical protein